MFMEFVLLKKIDYRIRLNNNNNNKHFLGRKKKNLSKSNNEKNEWKVSVSKKHENSIHQKERKSMIFFGHVFIIYLLQKLFRMADWRNLDLQKAKRKLLLSSRGHTTMIKIIFITNQPTLNQNQNQHTHKLIILKFFL